MITVKIETCKSIITNSTILRFFKTTLTSQVLIGHLLNYMPYLLKFYHRLF